jgi:hypothetical protein
MEALAQHIGERLKTKKFCLIFENELEQIWPRGRFTHEDRQRRIKDFARANQWEARIHDPGIRVSFRRLTPLASVPAGRPSPLD